jgi:uncharacterized membrane protein YeaQ/YmgE (transglycosylase-associated protein family)
MFALTSIDILLIVVITSGLLAGLMAYLMLPSFKRESEKCIKSMLIGIIFSLVVTSMIQLFLVNVIQGVPPEIYELFLWCAAFVPTLMLSLGYGLLSRRQREIKDWFSPERH